MTTRNWIHSVLVLIFVLLINVFGQSHSKSDRPPDGSSAIQKGDSASESTPGHFDGIVRFDYPSDWTLTKSDDSEADYFTFDSRDHAQRMILYVSKYDAMPCHIGEKRTFLAQTLFDRVAAQVNASRPVKLTVKEKFFKSIESYDNYFEGNLGGKTVDVDLVSLSINWGVVDLIYIRHNDDASANAAWELIRKTIKPGLVRGIGNGGDGKSRVIRGKAIKTPPPDYPLAARPRHISGTVTVAITIDEQGHVIEACAIEGPSIFWDAAVAAAKASLFTPATRDGKPVRVTGQMNFVFGQR